jgi:hypothetical protein
MAEHRLWLHPQSYMPASYYAAPQGRRCHLFVKKMRRAGQTPICICGRLTALPMILTREPSAEGQCNGFARRRWSGHTDPSVIDDAISCAPI